MSKGQQMSSTLLHSQEFTLVIKIITTDYGNTEKKKDLSSGIEVHSVIGPCESPWQQCKITNEAR